MAANIQLQKVASVQWLQDQDENDWFVIPGTEKALVANEQGTIRHRMTWFEFEIGWEQKNPGSSLSGERHGDRGYLNSWEEPVALAWILETGEELYRLMITAGCPLWTTELPIMQQWMEMRVFTHTNQNQLVLESGDDRDRRWRQWDKSTNRPRRSKAQIAADLEAKVARKAAREKVALDRQALLESDQYATLFAVIYGKPRSEITADDPQILVYYADRLTRYRLAPSEAQD